MCVCVCVCVCVLNFHVIPLALVGAKVMGKNAIPNEIERLVHCY